MKKMLIALTTLAFCGVAIASSGPLFRYVGNRTAQFAPQKRGHGKPGKTSTGFTSADTGINSNGFVYVTFKDYVGTSYAGVLEQYTFTADGAANWVCSTGGSGKGKKQATGTTETTYETSYRSHASSTVGNNGTASGGAAIPPPPAPTTGCSTGTWELGAVSYWLYSGALMNTTASPSYNADDVMTGSCPKTTLGGNPSCSQQLIGSVSAPTTVQ